LCGIGRVQDVGHLGERRAPALHTQGDHLVPARGQDRGHVYELPREVLVDEQDLHRAGARSQSLTGVVIFLRARRRFIQRWTWAG
jgi:hypothetical protein